MKSLLVLSFYLSRIAFVSSIILNETSLLFPSKGYISNQPPARGKPHFGSLIYKKHLMELKCLKKAIEDIRNKIHLRHQQPHKPLEVSLPQNLQHQISNIKKSRLNQIEIQNKMIPGVNQIILTPSKGFILEDHINKFLNNKESQSTRGGIILNDRSNNFNKEREKAKSIQQSTKSRKNNEKSATENIRHSTQNEANSEVTQNHYQKEKLPATNPVLSHRIEQQIMQNQPHGVKEFFRKEQSDLKNNSDFKNHHFDKQNYLKSLFLRRKQGRTSGELKLSRTNINAKNRKIQNFGTLSKSGNSSTFLLKETYNNSFSRTRHSGMRLDNDLSDLEKKTLENKFISQKIIQPHSSEMTSNSTGRSTKPEIVTNVPSTNIKVENIFATEATNTPPSILITNYSIENVTKSSVDNIELTTTAPEIPMFTSPEFFHKVNINVPNASFKSQMNEPPISGFYRPTEDEKKFITEEGITENESSTGFFFTSSKQLLTTQTTTAGILISKYPNKDSTKIQKNLETVQMETDSPEEELTKVIFTESTDSPLTTDFVIKNKKEQETIGKNSRKMHFNQQIPPSKGLYDISNPKNLGQRRSDILIDDLEDYFLQESGFSSNYMKQLKQNKNLNSSSDFIIQLIPFVVNDLRENRISSEDLPVLSEAFGGYWPNVLTLANSTNLDMLPLLKMKNEKDLNKILSTFFPEKSETSSYFTFSELEEADRDKFLAYYYEEDYTDLRMEEREYWKNEEPFKRD